MWAIYGLFGGLPGWLPADLAATVPGGGLSLLVARLPFTLALFLPPSPRPPSPPGKGGNHSFLMQGAAPLASPAFNRLRHLQSLPSRYPVGGLLSLSPACPAFSFLSCPHPPNPLPGGKGEIKIILCKGLRPLHPRGLGGMRHWVCLRKAGCGGGLAFLVACRPCPEPSLSFIPISRREDRAQTIGFSQYSIFGKSSGGSGGLFQESPSVLPSVLPVVSPVPSAKAVRRERVRERPSRCMTV